MKYLFLDDERKPSAVTWISIGGVGHMAADWQIVRSMDEAINWVRKYGFPDVISFDHDLGEAHYSGNFADGKTGYDFAKWLIEFDLDTKTMPVGFSFTVHSLNPVGKVNIENLLNNYIQFRRSKK